MKRLTEAFTANPSVSPDGKLFACLQAEGPGPFPWNIAVYPVDGPVDGARPTGDGIYKALTCVDYNGFKPTVGV